MKTRILFADNDFEVCDMFNRRLREEGFDVVVVNDLTNVVEKVAKEFFDIIVMELFFDNIAAFDTIRNIIGISPLTSILIHSKPVKLETVIKALTLGIADFIPKNRPIQDTVEVIKRLKTESRQGTIEANSNLEMVGYSENISAVKRSIAAIAPFDSTVLITGESGTGKEVVCRNIHESSRRKHGVFAKINCGAIPENLLESELFGYKKGAFTDAKTDKNGLFQISQGGTLFLDEVGELPLRLQVKLLRVLQENEIRPLGSSIPIKVDTRIVAATNKDLAEMCRKGSFREDLYFRLNVINIHLTPLRERREDIIPLFNRFLDDFSAEYDIKINPLSTKIKNLIRNHPWPGNARELKNTAERAIIFAKNGDINFTSLKESIEESEGYYLNPTTTEPSPTDTVSGPFMDAKSSFESKYLRSLLSCSHGNITEASRISKQYRANLYRMLRKHGINLLDYKYQ